MLLKWIFRVSAGRLLVGKEIEKVKRIPLIGLSPNSNPEALRQMSKVGLKRLKNMALTKLQFRRH